MVVRLGGRRWSAELPRSDEPVVRDLLTGDHVVLLGTPRPFRDVPLSWVRSRHLAGRLSVRDVRRGPAAAPWFRLAGAVHRRLAGGAASLGEDRAALYLGLVMGDDRFQSDLTRYRFQASGLTHLLAVSGQNVAFLLAVCAPVLRRCPIRARWWVGAAALALFVLVTRAEPSVLRAAAMAALALWAAVAGRRVAGLRVLALAVLGLLLVDPLLVHGTGFRLSVAATAGLLLWSRPLARRLPGPRWLAEPLAVTLAAQLATAPVLLTVAGGLPAVATVANLLAVPAAGAVMTLGLTSGLVAGLVRPEVASVLQLPTRVLVAWVDGVATWASRVPLLPVRATGVVVAAASVGLALWGRRAPRRSAVRRTSVVVACVLGAGVATSLVPPRPGVGVHRAAAGVAATVWPCGRVTVRVDDGAVDDVLESLRAVGVLQAAAVTGADRWAVPAVSQQLGAATGPSGPPCSLPP